MSDTKAPKQKPTEKTPDISADISAETAPPPVLVMAKPKPAPAAPITTRVDNKMQIRRVQF